jgi:acyl-coenzyme A thioesterase PaaI-like protein
MAPRIEIVDDRKRLICVSRLTLAVIERVPR